MTPRKDIIGRAIVRAPLTNAARAIALYLAHQETEGARWTELPDGEAAEAALAPVLGYDYDVTGDLDFLRDAGVIIAWADSGKAFYRIDLDALTALADGVRN